MTTYDELLSTVATSKFIKKDFYHESSSRLPECTPPFSQVLARGKDVSYTHKFFTPPLIFYDFAQWWQASRTMILIKVELLSGQHSKHHAATLPLSRRTRQGTNKVPSPSVTA